jgi:hypothetical protein
MSGMGAASIIVGGHQEGVDRIMSGGNVCGILLMLPRISTLARAIPDSRDD